MKAGCSVLFFSRTHDVRLFKLIEFYSEDIAVLELLGFSVNVENRLWRALSAGEDACYAWWWATSLPAVLAWRLRRKPVVLTGAVDALPVSSGILVQLRGRIKRRLGKWSVRLATITIAISDFELDRLRQDGATRAWRIYPSVDTSFFRPQPDSAHPSGVIVAQLNEPSMQRKGVHVAIEATALIRRVIPDYRLDVIGPLSRDGSRFLTKLRETLDCSGVTVHGEVTRERKRELLGAAWVYLQPSQLEGFGLAVAEAMASGAVPVCSDRGSLPEVVGIAGIIEPNRTPQSVAEAVIDLIENPVHRADLAVAARKRAVEEFSREVRVTRLGELLSGCGLR